MRAHLLLLAGVTAACGLSQRTWHATPEQMSPLAPLDTHVTGTIGPLALEPGAGTTPWPAMQEAWRIAKDRYLDRARIHEETATFLAFLDAFYQPLTPEMRIGFDQAHRSLERLEALDPYAIESVTLAYVQSTERLRLCIHNTGITAPCERDRVPHAAPVAPFEIREDGAIATLTVHDLSATAWPAFPAAKLAAAAGLVIDLRDAAGADPRPLMPWLRALTGRPDLAPLRAIERPASADAYVKAYADRYTDRGRDPEVWRALVGRGDDVARTPPTRQPIAIVVGHCESACELVARVLEAYAGAVVIGGVLARSGRLARDEPAMFELPHSHTRVYFHATRYLLAADIEAATGTTEEWRMFTGDAVEVRAPPADPAPPIDYLTWAHQEVAQRLTDPAGWPRCDAVSVPIVDGPKLSGLTFLASDRACEAGTNITLISQVPPSVLKRFLATCGQPLTTGTVVGTHFYLQTPRPPAGVLAQLAASDFVRSVRIECQHRYSID